MSYMYTQVPACYNPSSYEVESVVLTSPIQNDSVVSNISFSLPTDRRTFFNLTLTDGQGVELLFVNIQISKLKDSFSPNNVNECSS